MDQEGRPIIKRASIMPEQDEDEIDQKMKWASEKLRLAGARVEELESEIKSLKEIVVQLNYERLELIKQLTERNHEQAELP